MDGQERERGEADAECPRPAPSELPPPSIGMSRRAFTKHVGAGSAAVMGFAFAAPRISTINYARKAAPGSGPTTTTTSTTTTIPEPDAHIAVSTTNPCAGDQLRLICDGFAPRTAVVIQLDSAAVVLDHRTADGDGKLDIQVHIKQSDPTGDHMLRVIGIRPGGRTLVLEVALHIRTFEECQENPQGTTTTSTASTTTEPGPSSSTTVSPTTAAATSTVPPAPIVQSAGGGGGPASRGSGFLAFTGTDALDLALLGIAAAIGGRALYALARNADGEDDEEELD
jgi:hypothetical protein